MRLQDVNKDMIIAILAWILNVQYEDTGYLVCRRVLIRVARMVVVYVSSRGSDETDGRGQGTASEGDSNEGPNE